MFTRSQAYTIKVVICTSLVWILLDTIIIMNIRDCPVIAVPKSVKTHDTIESSTISSSIANIKSQSPGFLKRIMPAVFSPYDPGEMGRAVVVPEELKEKAKKLFSVNEFNLVASDLVSVNRSLRDVRMSECVNKKYSLEGMQSTSVIVVFHNEAWSTLLRTVHSIINRSPRQLLHEIILVDDASVRDFLGPPLDKYMSELPVPVHILRVKKRTGLIRARLRGAEKATGKILTFLDSHCECSEGWLEPILNEIRHNRTSVVCPVIDVINDDNFQYITGSDMTYGGFNWRLNFRWYSVPQRENDRRKNDRSIPLRTPTMAGGLFSINRDYFYEIGSYDQGMDIWGAENLEMSFRVWMCGGTLLISTCSHVGHVFRKQTPYRFPGGGTSRVIARNNARLANVWMDNWSRVYFAAVGKSDVVHTDMGDISERVNLRKKLKCKSFKWYLENVYPESQMPADYLSLGDIRTKKGDLCLDTVNNKAGTPLTVMRCHNSGGNQLFVYTLGLAIQSDDLAIVVEDGAVNFGNFRYALDKWRYSHKTLSIKHIVTNKCLSQNGKNVVLEKCNESDSQQWIIKDLKWKDKIKS